MESIQQVFNKYKYTVKIKLKTQAQNSKSYFKVALRLLLTGFTSLKREWHKAFVYHVCSYVGYLCIPNLNARAFVLLPLRSLYEPIDVVPEY